MNFWKWLMSLFFEQGVQAEQRTNANGQIVLPPPAPEVDPVAEAKKTVIDFSKITKDKNFYPLAARYEDDPDKGGTINPRFVVIHYTVSYDLENTVRHFKNNIVDVHYVVGTDGKVVQMVPNNKAAAHAGKSYYKGFTGLNQYSIGIEVVNIGPLTKVGDSYLDYYKKKYLGPVREKKGCGYQYWAGFTEAQEKAVIDICCFANQMLNIPVDNMIGHYECAPDRKIDPYGNFSFGTMEDFRNHMKKLLY